MHAPSGLPAQAEAEALVAVRTLRRPGHGDRDPLPKESQTARWGATDGLGEADVKSNPTPTSRIGV
jgi:hypothetical protein